LEFVMSEIPPLRVAFADDYPGVRTFLRSLLATDPAIDLVGEAGSADDMIRLCRATHPQIVLLDVHMPGPATPVTVRTLLSDLPSVKILIVSAEDDDVYVRVMATLPICGYLLKGDVPDHLLSAIHAIAAGATWYSPTLLPVLRTH
jgi:DNA-binding NarL/FixJ family response regulator